MIQKILSVSLLLMWYALVTLRHRPTDFSSGGFGMRTWSWLLDLI